jgi:hypothetical protein
MRLLACCLVFPKGQRTERNLAVQATQEVGTSPLMKVRGGGGEAPLAHKDPMKLSGHPPVAMPIVSLT